MTKRKDVRMISEAERTRPARPDISVIRLPEKYQHIEPDRRLPLWARRSNPIIRLHLGMYWRTILPEAAMLAKIIGVQAALVGLSLPWPVLFDLAMPTITAALLLLPMALYVYGAILGAVGAAAATFIVIELKKDTLNLLRATPYSTLFILASKVAAAIWRQVENLSLLVVAVSVMSLPVLIAYYATLFPLTEYALVSRAAMVAGLVVSVLRLLIEPFMVAAVGILAGAAMPMRASAIAATFVFSGFYFLLLNLPRLVEMAWPLRFILEFALPLALPPLIAWGALRLALHLLTRD